MHMAAFYGDKPGPSTLQGRAAGKGDAGTGDGCLSILGSNQELTKGWD